LRRLRRSQSISWDEASKIWGWISSLFPQIDVTELEDAIRGIKIPTIPEVVTKVFDKENIKVSYSIDIVESKIAGSLREMIIVSPTKNFSVIIVADGILKLRRDFGSLLEISQYLESIDAFEKNGGYVLRLSNISWIENILITIYVDEPTTFKYIYAIWDEKIK